MLILMLSNGVKFLEGLFILDLMYLWINLKQNSIAKKLSIMAKIGSCPSLDSTRSQTFYQEKIKALEWPWATAAVSGLQFGLFSHPFCPYPLYNGTYYMCSAVLEPYYVKLKLDFGGVIEGLTMLMKSLTFAHIVVIFCNYYFEVSTQL